MNRPKQGAPEIFSTMKLEALKSLDSKEGLKRLVTDYVAECGRKAEGPLQESKAFRKEFERLTAELGKAEAKLSERPNDADAETRVSELRRSKAKANRDQQAAYRCSREWVEVGEGLGLLLSQELGG